MIRQACNQKQPRLLIITLQLFLSQIQKLIPLFAQFSFGFYSGIDFAKLM